MLYRIEERATNLLRRLEWIKDYDRWGMEAWYCPECRAKREYGHADYCDIGKILRGEPSHTDTERLDFLFNKWPEKIGDLWGIGIRYSDAHGLRRGIDAMMDSEDWTWTL